MKFFYITVSMVLLVYSYSSAQKNCGTAIYYDNIIKRYPEMQSRYGVVNKNADAEFRFAQTGKVTIPIVVHIVYKTTQENLTDADIQKQVEILNSDFAGRNSDLFKTPVPFQPFIAGDCNITFQLVEITRTKTSRSEFEIDLDNGTGFERAKESIKFANMGGADGYPCSKFLNVWVGNIRRKNDVPNGLAGYATFPGGPCEYDGVVIHYKYFGIMHSSAPLDKGRTLTHEVGHWLNLRHISGDARCGNDFVDDTPTQEEQNMFSPNFPHITCNNGPDGDMFMNYMDYVNDTAMFMFSSGQKEAMRNIFVQRGDRSSFITSITENKDFIVENLRGDEMQPVFSGVKQSENAAIATWFPSLGIKDYVVSFKPLKSEKWQEIITQNNQVKFQGLSPGELYEILLTAVFENEKKAQSVPYIFVADKSYFHIPGQIKVLSNF